MHYESAAAQLCWLLSCAASGAASRASSLWATGCEATDVARSREA